MKNSSPKTLILVFLIPVTLVLLSGLALELLAATEGAADSKATMNTSFILLGLLGAAVALSFIAHQGLPLGRRLIMALGLVSALYLTELILNSMSQPIRFIPGISITENLQIRAMSKYLSALVIAWGLALGYFGLKAGYEGTDDDAPDEPAAR